VRVGVAGGQGPEQRGVVAPGPQQLPQPPQHGGPVGRHRCAGRQLPFIGDPRKLGEQLLGVRVLCQ